MVGPYDLSASMGLTGQFEHPEFISIMETIKNQAMKHNIAMGTHIVQPDEILLSKKIEEGYQFIAYSIDSVFLYNSVQIPKNIKQ